MAVRYTGPVQLARFRFEDGSYFADLRLREFRSVDDPSVLILFESKLGRRLCEMAGIVSCPACRTSMIVSSVVKAEGVRCVRCGMAVYV